jgi:hypothetical protein
LLAKWFKHEARRVYAILDESGADREQRRLAEWIGRKGGTVTAREIQQGCRWLKEPGKAEAALEELVKTGCGYWQDPASTPKGGRPGRVFALSTPSTVYKTDELPQEPSGSVDVDKVDDADAETPATEVPSALFDDDATAGPYSGRY